MTPNELRAIIAQEETRLFASYAVGRPPGWCTDRRTKDLICLSKWLHEELVKMKLDDLGRRILLHRFTRSASAADDLYELAATVFADAKADRINRKRKPHRRWG